MMSDDKNNFDDTTINVDQERKRKNIDSLGLRLKVLEGPDKGKEYPLVYTKITIGRKNTDIELSNPLVSRKHVEIEVLGRGYYFVKDLASRNGTFVNGESITNQRIKPYDEIKIGDTILTIIET